MPVLSCLSRATAPLLTLPFSLLALIATQPAAAASFCVNSEATAQTALSAARANGEADVIRFRSGFIELTDGLEFSTAIGTSDHLPLRLAGGYNAGCTERTGETVLDGNGLVRPLGMEIFGAQTIIIEHLTFIKGHSEANDSNGANLSVALFDTSGEASLRVDNCGFLLGSSEYTGGGFGIRGHGTVRFRNNLVLGNSAANYSAGVLSMQSGDAYLVSNTITDNMNTEQETTALYTRASGRSSTLTLSNNIVWGNDASEDLYLFPGGTITLSSNNIGTRNSVTLDPASSGNLSVDPQFANCGIGCFDRPLDPSSPLVNAGVNDPLGGLTLTDYKGNARRVGPKVDIGAYEYGLFADGFE